MLCTVRGGMKDDVITVALFFIKVLGGKFLACYYIIFLSLGFSEESCKPKKGRIISFCVFFCKKNKLSLYMYIFF